MKKMKTCFSPLITMGLALVLFSGCKDNGPTIVIPTLTTTAISDTTDTGAKSGGSILADGGATISASGVCWSKVENPRIEDTKTTDVAVSGVFSSTISGLEANTTYHVRAYATNSVGTGYGNDLTFNTKVTPYKDQEGNIFTTVLVGDKLWSAKNLNVHHFRNGDPIPVYKDNLTLSNGTAATTPWASDVEPYATAAMIEPVMGDFVYVPDYSDKFGGLYNWYAATDARSLAPEGWHVATIDDWKALMTTIGYVPGGDEAANATAISKIRGTDYWTDGGGGTNTTGLSIPPAMMTAYDPSGDYFGFPYDGNPVPTNMAFQLWLNAPGTDLFYKDCATIIHSTTLGLLNFNAVEPANGRESWGSTRSYRGASVRIVKD
jgi:uncharacterized protein (TIGR02145 family)